VLETRISDFWPVKDAPKGLLRNSNILSRHAGHHTEAKPSHKDAPYKHTNGESAQERDEMTHVVYSFLGYYPPKREGSWVYFQHEHADQTKPSHPRREHVM
jgi:hypothetical protein